MAASEEDSQGGTIVDAEQILQRLAAALEGALGRHGQSDLGELWSAFKDFARTPSGVPDPEDDFVCFEAELSLKHPPLSQTYSVELRRHLMLRDEDGEFHQQLEVIVGADFASKPEWDANEYAYFRALAGMPEPASVAEPDVLSLQVWMDAVAATPAFTVALGEPLIDLRKGAELQ